MLDQHEQHAMELAREMAHYNRQEALYWFRLRNRHGAAFRAFAVAIGRDHKRLMLAAEKVVAAYAARAGVVRHPQP